MTDVLGVASYLLLPLIGIGICSLEVVRRERLPVRLAIATAAGALVAGLTLALLSLLHIEWSRTALLVILGAVTIVGIWRVRKSSHPSVAERFATNAFALAGTIIAWALTLYATLTARESCGDLQFTWGPKAIRFFRAGGLDPQVLRTWPQLTIDYPPLQTLLFSWSNLVSHQFSWWAAVLLSPLFLAITLALLRSWTRDDVATLLIASTLTYTYALAYPAGCAEPLLLLFEVIVIGALTYVDDPRAQTLYVTLGLAGAAWTKLEGSTFAVAAFLTILLVQRQPRRAFLVVIPAALLMASWMGFVFYNDLLWMYRGAALPMYPAALPIVLRTLAKVAKFELYWLPWIVPAVVIALGNVRRALAPLSIALLTTCATIYFYLHYPDPTWWIESSSTRVILTPLAALLIAAAAAHAPLREARDVVC
ncbi:MAG TPA: hypothetical protein VF824_18710 [Thermoanaerobaculia bacterium]|jgi:hypothetical protein